jgi:hypothetical protein
MPIKRKSIGAADFEPKGRVYNPTANSRGPSPPKPCMLNNDPTSCGRSATNRIKVVPSCEFLLRINGTALVQSPEE